MLSPFGNEQLIPIREACELVPGRLSSKPAAFGTLLRWILDGSRSISGRRVKLEAVRIGSRWLTSREAIERFMLALSEQNAEPIIAPRTPTKRRRAAEHARAELERAGV